MSLWSYGQEIPTNPNIEDDNGRQGTWTILYDNDWNVIDTPESAAFYRIINFKDDKPVGLVKDYYRSGQLQMEAQMIDDRTVEMIGIATWYHPDGTTERAVYFPGDKSLNEVLEEYNQLDPNSLHENITLAFANLFHDNRRAEARPLYERYVKMVKKKHGDNSLVYAEALRLLAWDYLRHMDFINAEPLFFQSKKIIDQRKADAPTQYALILNDIGDYLSHIGRHEEALEYFNEAMEIAKKHFDEDDYFIYVIIHNSASCYRAIGDYQKAAELSELAVADCIKRFGKYHRETGNALKALSFAYNGLRDSKKAKETMEEALDIYSNLFGDMHPEYLDVLYQIGIFHIQARELEEASKVFLVVYTKFQQLYGDMHPSTTRAERSYGFALYRLGRKDEGIEILRNSGLHRQEYIQKYFDYMNEEARETLYQQQFGFTYFQSTLAMASRETHPVLISDMLNAQLRNKAILLSTTNAIKKRILESNDRKLIELYNKSQDIRQQLGSFRDMTNEDIQKNHRINRDSLVEVLENMDRDLNRLSSIYATANSSPDWRAIRDKLQKDEAFVELHSYQEFDLGEEWTWTQDIRYVALIVTAKTKETPSVVLLENGNYLENEAITYYSNKMKYKMEDKESYKLYWLPLEKELKKYNKILFSADGVFHKVNLGTLLNPATGKYLSEEKNIQIITSGRDLLENPREPSPVKLGMLIGNPSFWQVPEGVSGTLRGIELFSDTGERGGITPLPGAESEVNSIAGLLNKHGWKSIVLTNEDAEETALKDMLKPNVLHIATHGFFHQEGDNSNPLHNSGLLFTGAANSLTSKEKVSTVNDGILTSFEAINLNIDNTDLVVLSACETGLGEIQNGEGIYGLQRAFKIAGARTIIMSLWKVDDEATNILMTKFYDNWLSKNMTKRDAFAAAQNELRIQYPHPYYWGAFVVLGE